MTTETTYYEENFSDNLDAGWTWLREHPEAWCIRDNALEIRVEPGVAETVRNALVRMAPDRNEGSFAIEVTVSNYTYPTQQYEQAGITWYNGGKPVFKLVKELIDGGLYIIPGRPSMETKSVRLRLVVTANTWEALYRPEGETAFLSAATGELPAPNDDQVSLQCYQGPPDQEHWIRFESFCIKQVS